MPRFAVLDREGEAAVINILVADSLETAQQLTKYHCVEVGDEVGTHWSFDGINFIEPIQKEEANA